MTTVLRSRLQFTVLHAFERRKELPAVSDLRQGFFATKNCTASLIFKGKRWVSTPACDVPVRFLNSKQ